MNLLSESKKSIMYPEYCWNWLLISGYIHFRREKAKLAIKINIARLLMIPHMCKSVPKTIDNFRIILYYVAISCWDKANVPYPICISFYKKVYRSKENWNIRFFTIKDLQVVEKGSWQHWKNQTKLHGYIWLFCVYC